MRRPLLLALACLAFGFAVLFYRGPGWAFLRHTAGDAAAAALLYALVWLALRSTWRRHAVIAGLGALTVELVQLSGWVDRSSPLALHLIFGSTFDWADLGAYAVGLVIAVWWQRRR
jgi:hypothetical protein